MGIGTIDDASGDFLFRKKPLVESLSLLGFFAYDSVKERALCNDLWRSWGYYEARYSKHGNGDIQDTHGRGVLGLGTPLLHHGCSKRYLLYEAKKNGRDRIEVYQGV